MWRYPLLLVSCACALLGQALYRPDLSELKFPMIESNVVYGRASAAFPIDGVSTAVGSLYRSDDGGRTWVSLYLAPQGDYQFIDDFAVHPERPATVYAVRSRARGGFYRSEDSGRTWEAINAGLPASGELRDVAILRGAGEEGRARIGDELYRLDAGNKTWVKLSNLPPNTTILEFDPRGQQRGGLLALPGNYYATTDGGANWIVQGKPPSTANLEGFGIAFDLKDPNYVYLRTEALSNSQGRCPAPGAGLWRSADGGRTYTLVYDSPVCNSSPRVWVDPLRSNVYIRTNFTGNAFCRSQNRGDNFVCQDDPIQATTPALFAMNPRNGDLFRSRFQLVSRDGGASWVEAPASFRPTLWSPSPVSFSLPEGESSTVRTRIGFADVGSVNPAATYRAALAEAAPWLEVVNPTDTLASNTEIRLTASALALTPGVYTARVRIESDAALNSPVFLTLRVSVTPRAVSGVRYNYVRLAGGNAPGAFAENALATSQPISSGRAVARDAQGNIYVMTDRRLRRIAPDGRMLTLAGDGTQGETPDNTPAAQAKFAFVDFLAVAREGTIYIGEGIGTKVYALKDGVVRVVLDATSPAAYRLSNPRGMSVSPSGAVYVSDASRIVRLEPGRTPEVVAAFGNFPRAAGATLFDLAAESDSSWILSDPLSHRIFRWSSAGLIAIAGTRAEGFSGDGGLATQALLRRPQQLTIDSEGNIIFNDAGNSRLRLIRPDGRIFTVSGSGPSGPVTTASGSALSAAFVAIAGLAAEPNGGVLVMEFSTLSRLTRLPFETPILQPGSAVNSASSTPALTPGMLATVYGANLAIETRLANFAPLATALGGAEILLNGQPIPVGFASPNQVNVQIPPTAPLGPAKLRARVDGKLSAEIDVQIGAAAPGIFIYGNNRAVAQNQDGAINAEGVPAAVGTYGVLYVTGIGATDNPVAAGALSPSSPLARAVSPAELRVGDAVANVLFIGLTPGFIGLGQVNFEVPPVAAGDHPITLRLAGVLSNAPLFSVSAP
jgi:uncharacterized protein (TIGR03437 family)